MSRKLYLIILLFSFLIASAGCKTASKLYESGDYHQAVDLAVKKIQKNKDAEENKNVLQNAYRLAVEKHESKIRNLSDNNNELKWEWIFNEYTLLQKLYNAIQRFPEAQTIVPATD
jgi:hypothetical protein